MSAPAVPVPAHLTTFIAFDFGLKRTGVAVGNRLLKTAQPQGSIHAEGSARFDGVANQRIAGERVTARACCGSAPAMGPVASAVSRDRAHGDFFPSHC